MKTIPSEISPLMTELSNYIANAIRRPLPPEVKERAKVHFVDAYAAMISGSRLLPGRKALIYVKAQGGKPEAGVIGSRVAVPAANAAMANAMCCHADETDDTHPPSRTHPGTSVVPAALAIAERQQLAGEAMLRAIVLGYDICVRLLLALKPNPLWSAGHQTIAFGGVFGAASAAGALLEFDARSVRFMLSYTAEQASGLYTLLRDSDHIEKAYVLGGMPASHGVAAALMVAHGFTGVDVFIGERNFFCTFSPQAEPAQLTRGLGREYEILRASIKRWPAGGPIQGPLHVLYELMQQHGLQAADIGKLVAHLPDKELGIVDNREMPDICLQHLLAVMLLDGTVTFKSAHDPVRMRDPKVLALRRRMQAVGNPSLTDTLRRWRCVMDVTLKDGRKLSHQTMAAKGSFVNLLTRQDEQDKALDLIAPVLGKRRAQKLMTALWDIDHVKNVRLLRKLVSS